jgi:hypothetical protein
MVIEEFRTNRYDEATKTLTFTDNQARAFEAFSSTTPSSSARTPPGTGWYPMSSPILMRSAS